MVTASTNNYERSNDLSAIEQNNCSALISSDHQNLLPTTLSTVDDLLKQYTVSFATNVHKTKFDRVTLDRIVKMIREGVKLKECIDKVRAIEDREKRQELKEAILPYMSFCAFENDQRKNKFFLSTEFLILDADHVPNLADVRLQLQQDSDVFMVFLSPSGDGLKIAYRLKLAITNQIEYGKIYKALSDQCMIKYGKILDGCTKDPARATYLSHDPDIYVNPRSTLLVVEIPEKPVSEISRPPAKRKKAHTTSAFLPAEVGDRTGQLTVMVGCMNRLGMEEQLATNIALGWNQTLPTPHSIEKITSTVSDMYQLYEDQAHKFIERDGSYFRHAYTSKGWQETQVTNFVIRTKELLIMPNGDCLTCDIETEKGIVYENVILSNSDWHSKTKLLNAIGKSDCNFLTSDADVQPLCMHVIDQVTVRKTGTSMIGLHGDIWVTKDRNIMESGWAPQQEIVPYGKGSDAFYHKIEYTELNDSEYHAMLAMLYTNLPAINDLNIILPWLGWFLAAPMKERLQKLIGGFPLAFVHGGQGSGKTSSSQQFMRLAGYNDRFPYLCTMKPFPMLSLLSSTNGVPLFFDELKKSDMGDKYDQMLRRMREIYVGVAESKGNADQTTTTYELKAPVAIMGEWGINQPAVKERLIMVSFTNAAKIDQGMQIAFANLKKLPLEGFMPRFIQFCLGEDIMYRYSIAERLVGMVFKNIDVAPRVRNNMSVMVMGLGLWKAFGRKNGIMVGAIEFQKLLKRQLREITGNESGAVQSAVDQLIEGFGQMARSAKGIVSGVDYKLDGMKLVIQFNKVFPLFKQYAFQTKYEYDVLDGDSYGKLFDETGYVIKKNAQIWWGEKQIRSLVIDITKAKAAGVDLEGFGV